MKRALSNPLEPQAIGFTLQPRQSHSPFMILPLDVIEQIFALLSRSDLFHFEQAYWSHSTLTDKVWKVLREEDFLDQLNWEVCQGSHRSNYLLSKVIISYVKALPFEKQRNKFVPMREKFPPFNAFAQLTELLRKRMEIPEALADQLREEPSLQLITELYQFGNQYKEYKNLDEVPYVQSVLYKEGDPLKQFNKGLKTQIKTSIQQGTTCLSLLATHFFSGFRLNSIVIELAFEAFKKGDLSCFYEMRKYSIPSLVKEASDSVKEEIDFPMLSSIEEFLDFLIEWNPSPCFSYNKEENISTNLVNLTFSSTSDLSSRLDNMKRLWLQIRGRLSQVHIPLEFLKIIFVFHLHNKNWKEAEQYVERMLKHNNQLPGILPLAAAKVYANLQQWNKADAFYRVLGEGQLQLLDASMQALLLTEALEIKVKLGDLQGFCRYVNHRFSQVLPAPVSAEREDKKDIPLFADDFL